MCQGKANIESVIEIGGISHLVWSLILARPWQNVLDDMLVETRSMIVDFGPKVTSGFETCVGYLRYLEITEIIVFARPDLILVLVNIVNLVIAEAQVAEAEYSARSWRHLTSWQFKILCVCEYFVKVYVYVQMIYSETRALRIIIPNK